ncbi:hypothetical protein ACOMHN_036029 [Nucella lapillus]
MDEESSTKFIGSLTKFLQSLCNGYVEFEDGVELIGHIYLSVDAGRTGKKLNYFLNEKVCKNDNSVTFISNSFHAQPESKGKGQTGKDSTDGKKDDEAPESVESVPKSTNSGTIPSRAQMSSRSAPSPEPSSCAQTGSSGQSGRSGDDLYPVMLHQNQSVFPSTSSSYPSATATSQHPGFPGASTSQSDPFNPQDGADPSVTFDPSESSGSSYAGTTGDGQFFLSNQVEQGFGNFVHRGQSCKTCQYCGRTFSSTRDCLGHVNSAHLKLKPYVCDLCQRAFAGKKTLNNHRKTCSLLTQASYDYSLGT